MAILPVDGSANGRLVAELRVSQASGSISALRLLQSLVRVGAQEVRVPDEEGLLVGSVSTIHMAMSS